MYGGLFGDLPQAKKTSQSSTAVETTHHELSSSSSPVPKVSDNPSIQGDNGVSPTPVKNRGDGASSVSSLQKAVGVTGTTMAFIPQNVRKNRKRKPDRKRKDTTVDTTTSLSSSSNPNSHVRGTTTTAWNPAFQSISTTTTTVRRFRTSAEVPPVIPPSSDNSDFHHYIGKLDPIVTITTKATEDEKDEEVVIDPYNPYLPNDLQQYWAQKALEDQRVEQERQMKETKFLQQQVADVVARQGSQRQQPDPSTTMLQGGERQISNLPAWFIKQQQEHVKQEETSDHSPRRIKQETETDTTSHGSIRVKREGVD